MRLTATARKVQQQAKSYEEKVNTSTLNVIERYAISGVSFSVLWS